jgi:L-fucose mutarotase
VLRGLHPLLTADLLHAMLSMGHGDELAIVDANFPAATVGRRVVALPGADAPDTLDAILSVFPLDTAANPAVLTMEVAGDPGATPDAVVAFFAVLTGHGLGDLPFRALRRYAFYERARDAFAVVRTGELRPYGNLLLVKGVVNSYTPAP